MFVQCSAAGCDREAQTKGLCQKHYVRLWRHGHTDDTRPEGYGSKIKHPMYVIWKDAKQFGELCERWSDDFWRFVEEAGPRPDKKHRLYRLDESKIIEPGNIVWRVALVTRKEGETDKQLAARRQRVRRKLLPEETRKTDLRRKYGLTPEQYQEMHDEREGKCDICGQEERILNCNLKKKTLAVDHCHDNGHVRGLLCHACNAGIGHFQDDISLMKAAIDYLEEDIKRQANGTTLPQNKKFSWPSHKAANGREKVIIQTPDGPMDVNEAAAKYDIAKATIMTRIRKKWPADKLLIPPTK